MIFVALKESADKGELLLVQDGMCRYHRRRDGVVVIREILVLPQHRRSGIGKALIKEVLEKNARRVVHAKCPVDYLEAQLFWAAMGFTLVSTKDGINLWQRPSNA